MKILYLVQTFPPEPGATKRPARQAAEWVKAGHQVTVITALPSYPLGRRMQGYQGRIVARETVDGVEVIRVPSLCAPNIGWFRRGLSFASFAAMSSVVGSQLDRPDLVIGSTPKPGTELAAYVLSRGHRRPLVLEVRDVLPNSLVHAQLLRRSKRLTAMEWLYRWLYGRANALAVVDDEELEQMAQLGIARDKVWIWPHAWDARDLGDRSDRDRVRAALGWSDAFVVAYAGSFSARYRVREMVMAARELADTLPRLRLLLIGTGATMGAVEAAAAGLTNVHLAGGLDPGSVGPYLQAADLFLWPAVNRHPLGSTKMVEYLAVGRPIVALEEAPGAGAALAQLGVGVGVEAGDSQALACALRAWADDSHKCRAAGERGRCFARERERATVATSILEDLHRLLGPTTRTPENKKGHNVISRHIWRPGRRPDPPTSL